MLINNFFLFFDDLLIILTLSLLLLFSSWLGIAFCNTFLDGLFHLELVYLSLIIIATILSTLTSFFLLDLFIIFIIFFAVCDSILGLILTLIVFKTNKTTTLTDYSYLN